MTAHPLPAWLARLLGIQSGPGEGATWSLVDQWTWPPWVTLLAVILIAALVVIVYLKENPQVPRALRMFLAGIRLTLAGLLLFMLAQFALSLQKTGLPYVAVLVDDTLSMTTADRYLNTRDRNRDKLRAALAEAVHRAGYDVSTRWNLARTLLAGHDAAVLRSIAGRYKLRLYYLTGAGGNYRTGPRASEAADPDGLVRELQDVEPSGEQTRLGAAIHSVLDDLRGTAPAALVLLSDGVNTEGPDLVEGAATARRKGVPLFVVALGDSQPDRSLKLSDLSVEEFVFVHDRVNFEVQLTGTGYAGQEVRLLLRRQDQPKVLAEVKVKVGADGRPQTVRLPYRPDEEGEFQFTVEIEPVAGDAPTTTDHQERIVRTVHPVRVRKEKIRVLLVQAYPSYEFRYLRNMLGRDPTIDLKTVLQDADEEHAEPETGGLATSGPASVGGAAATGSASAGSLQGFPVRKEDLFRYDVVILGDVNPALLSAAMLANLVDFVEQPAKGGSLICIAGPRYMPLAFRNTPLARILPVSLATVHVPSESQDFAQPFHLLPTDQGLASPQMQLGDTPEETQAIWQNLPPLYWCLETPDLKPGAFALAEHSRRQGRDGKKLPLIVLQHVTGNVLFHATDETWRWRFRSGDTYFARYWIQTIRYLSRSKLADAGRSATLSADRAKYRQGEPVRLRVRFDNQRLAPPQDDGVTVVVEGPKHATQRLKLHRTAAGSGVFEGLLAALPPDDYHAWIAIPSLENHPPATEFSVVAHVGDSQGTAIDAVELARAAEVTKGHYYAFDADTARHLLHDLPEGRQVPVETLPPRPLWNAWPTLALFLGLLVSEWVLRKLGGMV
jgi:hypothetical protein